MASRPGLEKHISPCRQQSILVDLLLSPNGASDAVDFSPVLLSPSHFICLFMFIYSVYQALKWCFSRRQVPDKHTYTLDFSQADLVQILSLPLFSKIIHASAPLFYSAVKWE
jgi:hypothetical protein